MDKKHKTTDRRPHVRFVLCPGEVTSEADGQRHYVGAMALAQLYGVRLDECEIYEPAPQWTETAFRQAQVRTLGLIRLTPRADGDYAPFWLATKPTRSQKLRDAGYTRRPTWRSLPSDE